MPVPSLEDVIRQLQDHFQIRLDKLAGKQIIYHGQRRSGQSILICSPQSKLHGQEHGWIDLTAVQYDLLSRYDVSILALRIENSGVYYFYFNELQPFLTKQAMLYNKHEGDHWKLTIWPETIEVRGNDLRFQLKPNVLPAIE